MRARPQIPFVAFLALFGALAVEPAHAFKRCLSNEICWSAEALDWRTRERHISLSGGKRIGKYVPKHYNVRIGGRKQFEVTVSRSFRGFTVVQDTTVHVQACRKLTLRSICTDWASFKVDF